MMAPPLVLLTGINGFVGAHMSACLLTQNMNVLGIGLSATCTVLDERLKYACCDIAQLSEVQWLLDTYNFDYIVHLAGANDVKASYRDPMSVIRTNTWSTLNLLETVRLKKDGNLKGFLAVGTAYEYELKGSPLRETDAVQPTSPYAWSKQLMASILQMYGYTYGIPTIIARTFNLIGPGYSTSVCAQLARQVVQMEKGLLPSKLVLGNQAVKRDFLDVRDAVLAYSSLLQLSPPLPGSIYNVCSGTSHSIESIVSLFMHYATVPFTIETDKSLFRAGEAAVVQGDNSKLSSATGWRPLISLEQSIRDTLIYYRNQPLD
jgi:GDP-4-dehydro-6-deoxy-D-mannose reductase